MMNVYCNGVLLQKSSDYTVNGEQVTFSHPPQRGDRIDFSGIGQNPFTYTKTADGFSKTFILDQVWQDTIAHNSLMNRAWNHREHPMVKDLLEQLEAAVTLIKE